MSIENLDFNVCDALPAVPDIVAGRIYIYKKTGAKSATLYRGSNDASALVPLDGYDPIKNKLIHFGEEAPITSDPLFWLYSGGFFVRTVANDVDTWVALQGGGGTGGASWLTGTGVPEGTLGALGDMYLRSTGELYKKEATGWEYTGISLAPNPQGIRVISPEETPDLATEEALADELLIVRGIGQYVHRVGDYLGGSDFFILPSSNGSWYLESVSMSFMDEAISEALNYSYGDEPLADLSPLRTTLNRIIDEQASKKVQSGLVTLPVTSVSQTSVTVTIPGVSVGDFLSLTPGHPMAAGANFTHYISGEETATIMFTTSDAIEISAPWSYLLVKKDN